MARAPPGGREERLRGGRSCPQEGREGLGTRGVTVPEGVQGKVGLGTQGTRWCSVLG